MNRSKLYRVNLKDILRSLLVVIISAFLASLLPTIQSGNIPNTIQLKNSLLIGLCAGLTYLIKNFYTNSDGKFFKKERKKLKE